ncbi:hypothetical protein B0I35DRAFT_429426 [Stachybotrys elegans]|uniref:MARVEL domain-containing protein n=1 Tax=Stachybotrys elegans TaxID=80388 RepID=A0A8K0WQZ3_9HYPO|nr:hypothetical protein B0I35DRAFT_429426 [Stachybotrys elegans]
MASNGGAHKFLSVILRVCEIGCGAIVMGILGHFTYILGDYNAHADGRIVYAMVVAGLAIIYSFLLVLPFNVLFKAFPIDFILFVMWLIAFALLANRAGTCSGDWYWSYWFRYWNIYDNFWDDWYEYNEYPGGSGCGFWRTVLAFSFIGMVLHLLSGILGAYVVQNYRRLRDGTPTPATRTERLFGRRPKAVAAGQNVGMRSTGPSVV